MNATPSSLDPRTRVPLQKLQKLITRRNHLIESGLPCPLVRFRIRRLMYRLRALEAESGAPVPFDGEAFLTRMRAKHGRKNHLDEQE